MRQLWMLCLVVVVFVGFNVRLANALPKFKSEFQKKYVKEGSDDIKAAFKALKNKCLVCHALKPDGKMNKNKRNAYGKALDDRIEGDAAKRWKNKNNRAAILAELKKAFSEVEEEKTKDEKETYGERMEQGKLPVEAPVKKPESSAGDAGKQQKD